MVGGKTIGRGQATARESTFEQLNLVLRARRVCQVSLSILN